MRKILFLLILINSFNLFAQYEDKWKEVYQLELDGKIKSAQEKVQEIYKVIFAITFVFSLFSINV